MSEQRLGREDSREIVEWFVPNVIPRGGAPESIKAQWIGVPLPVRRENQLSGDGIDVLNIANSASYVSQSASELVPVSTPDGIKALGLAGRLEAVQWWGHWHSEEIWLKSHFITPNNPHVLIFQRAEGESYDSDGILEVFPEAQSFDELDPSP